MENNVKKNSYCTQLKWHREFDCWATNAQIFRFYSPEPKCYRVGFDLIAFDLKKNYEFQQKWFIYYLLPWLNEEIGVLNSSWVKGGPATKSFGWYFIQINAYYYVINISNENCFQIVSIKAFLPDFYENQWVETLQPMIINHLKLLLLIDLLVHNQVVEL